MALFRRTKKNRTAPHKQPGASVSSVSAVDALADLLQISADWALPNGASQELALAEAEAWKRHVLLGAPVEGVHTEAPHQRDWRGVRDYYRDLRKREHERYLKEREEFNTLIWSLIQGVQEMAGTERKNSDRLNASVKEINEVMQDSPVNELKEAVALAIDTVAEVIVAQRSDFDRKLNDLGENLNEMRDQLFQVQQQLKRDPLTDLYNRRAFDQTLARSLEFANISGDPPCLLMVDLDHFKRVNDRYGHQAGDLVLQEVANALVRAFPHRNDFISRYGGEEFAIILAGVRPENRPKLAERVLNAVRDLEVHWSGHRLWLTCSVGFTSALAFEPPEAFIRRADEALYQAKAEGRDRFVNGDQLHHGDGTLCAYCGEEQAQALHA